MITKSFNMIIVYFNEVKFDIWFTLPHNLFLLGRHPPQDGCDKTDGHLDVQGKVAQVPVGFGMMSLLIGHGCSLAELFLDARLDTANDLPSLWTKASQKF